MRRGPARRTPRRCFRRWQRTLKRPPSRARARFRSSRPFRPPRPPLRYAKVSPIPIPEIIAEGWFDGSPKLRGKTGLPEDQAKRYEAYGWYVQEVGGDGNYTIGSYDYEGEEIEVDVETDFVARNDTFQAFVSECAGLALAAEGDIELNAGREATQTTSAQITRISANPCCERGAALIPISRWRIQRRAGRPRRAPRCR